VTAKGEGSEGGVYKTEIGWKLRRRERTQKGKGKARYEGQLFYEKQRGTGKVTRDLVINEVDERCETTLNHRREVEGKKVLCLQWGSGGKNVCACRKKGLSGMIRHGGACESSVREKNCGGGIAKGL